jgi:hypothetical protein
VSTAFRALGFANVYVTDGQEVTLRSAVRRYAQREAKVRPVISPVCPAAVNLIQVRFPALIHHVAPFVSPIEAAQYELAAYRNFFVISCPAQRTALMAEARERRSVVTDPLSLRLAVLPMIAVSGDEIDELPSSASPVTYEDVLQVSGIRRIQDVLERVEDGLLGDVRVLELFACDQGCFGSPGMSEDPFVARHRWRRMSGGQDRPGKAVRRSVPYRARRGRRPDPDMSKAIAKLSRIDRLAKSLPGRNCGSCGAPTCTAHAEDMALGRVKKITCPHSAGSEENPT